MDPAALPLSLLRDFLEVCPALEEVGPSGEVLVYFLHAVTGERLASRQLTTSEVSQKTTSSQHTCGPWILKPSTDRG